MNHWKEGPFFLHMLLEDKGISLVGDYLLAKGLLLSLDHDDFPNSQLLSEAVRQMSEGDYCKLKNKNTHLQEDTYFEIIKNKTGSYSLSSAAGSYSLPKTKRRGKMRVLAKK